MEAQAAGKTCFEKNARATIHVYDVCECMCMYVNVWGWRRVASSSWRQKQPLQFLLGLVQYFIVEYIQPVSL